MPKPYTLPTLIDESLRIDLSLLKKQGCLKPESKVRSILKWSSTIQNESSIAILLDTTKAGSFALLSYNFNGKPRAYRIKLCSIQSNLGKGYIHYFVCPYTHKKCRKLYLVNGYFLHRSAFEGAMYTSQTLTKKVRSIDKYLRAYVSQDSLKQELNSSYFKRYYAGKPTKRYLKIKKQLELAEKITYQDIERLLLLG